MLSPTPQLSGSLENGHLVVLVQNNFLETHTQPKQTQWEIKSQNRPTTSKMTQSRIKKKKKNFQEKQQSPGPERSLTIWPSNSISKYLEIPNQKYIFKQNLYRCVYSSIIHYRQQVEITQMPINLWMKK